MISKDKTIRQIIGYFDPTLEDDIDDLEKDYVTKVSALIGFCEMVEKVWEGCKNERDAFNELELLANKAREFLADDGL